MKNLVILATGAALGVAAVLTVACAAPDGTVTEHPPVVEQVTETPEPEITLPATPEPVVEPVAEPVVEPVTAVPAPVAPAPVTHSRPADEDRATGPVDAYDTGVLFCGALADVAVDVDPHGNAWAYCDPR